MNSSRFVELTNVVELDNVIDLSHRQAQLVFLYDPWCPISAAATRQIARIGRDVVAIDVSRRHDVSRQIELRTGIRHESPQAIVIDHGVAVWDASHSNIDSRSIALKMGTEATPREAPGSATTGDGFGL